MKNFITNSSPLKALIPVLWITEKTYKMEVKLFSLSLRATRMQDSLPTITAYFESFDEAEEADYITATRENHQRLQALQVKLVQPFQPLRLPTSVTQSTFCYHYIEGTPKAASLRNLWWAYFDGLAFNLKFECRSGIGYWPCYIKSPPSSPIEVCRSRSLNLNACI